MKRRMGHRQTGADARRGRIPGGESASEAQEPLTSRKKARVSALYFAFSRSQGAWASSLGPARPVRTCLWQDPDQHRAGTARPKGVKLPELSLLPLRHSES